MNLSAEIKPGIPITPEFVEQFEMVRIVDHRDIDSVFKHKDIYEHLSDDYTQEPDELDTKAMVENDIVYFLAGVVDEKVASMFFYHPHNQAMYEVHSAVLPEYRGKLAVKMAAESLKWMFTNTECRKVITHVPIYNIPALSIAKRVGMIVEGVNRASIMKSGTMTDQTILGITKEESLCQQQQ